MLDRYASWLTVLCGLHLKKNIWPFVEQSSMERLENMKDEVGIRNVTKLFPILSKESIQEKYICGTCKTG